MEPIRQFIKPYCRLDKHAQQAGGNYFINTLQLDNNAYSLHLAKSEEPLIDLNYAYAHTGLLLEKPRFFRD